MCLRSRSRPSRKKIGGGIVALIVAMLAAGCGGHILSLTGGSIPIGTANLQGRAVRADDIGKPVANAAVTLSLDSAVAKSHSDQAGTFAFEKVGGATYLCTIEPTPGAGLRQWSYSVRIPDGARAQLMAAVLPSTTDPSDISGVRIVPGSTTMHVGDTLPIRIDALGTGGQVLDVRGSLMMVGDVGDLGTDGTLHATKAGIGVVSAWAGYSFASATITVVP